MYFIRLCSSRLQCLCTHFLFRSNGPSKNHPFFLKYSHLSILIYGFLSVMTFIFFGLLKQSGDLCYIIFYLVNKDKL